MIVEMWMMVVKCKKMRGVSIGEELPRFRVVKNYEDMKNQLCLE